MHSLKKFVENTWLIRSRFLLPVTILLVIGGFVHMVWFPVIYTNELIASQRAEAEYLQILSQRLSPILELGDDVRAREKLDEILQERPDWVSIEIDGDLTTDIHLRRDGYKQRSGNTYITVPIETSDLSPLALTVGIDFGSYLQNRLSHLNLTEWILLAIFVVSVLGGYFIYEYWFRKPLLSLSRSAEKLLQSASLGIRHNLPTSELGKLSLVFDVMQTELSRYRLLINDRHKLLEIIRHSQLHFIRDVDPAIVFRNLLEGLLDITDSEYGYIGEVLYTADGKRYLKIIACIDTVQHDESQPAHPENTLITNPDTLTGNVINNAEVTIIDSPDEGDASNTGLDGVLAQPRAFLGIPFMRGRKVIGMFGIANRERGYDQEIAEFLQPVTSTCTSLVEATKNERERQRVAAELEDKAEHIKAIVDTVVDGIITIDENGIITSFNPAAEEIFGYSSTEVIGKNVNLLMPEPHRSAHDDYLNTYQRTGERQIIGIGREVEGMRRDGTVFPLDLAVSEMYAGGNRMFTGVVRDITERKATERMKNEFISVVSHELRTPLTSIHGSLRLIESGVVGDISSKCQELVSLANNNVERLVRLINDLLDIEKMEAGKYTYKPEITDMREVIEYAIQESTGYAEEYNVEFVLEDIPAGIMCNLDHDRIVQVIVNLLSNAAKHSPAGERVTVSAAHDAGIIRITVSDKGPGIPPEFQASVFEKFCQSDASDSRKLGGTGLGLSICRSIVEAHGGEIGFDTRPGVGTNFYFELPAVGRDDRGKTGERDNGGEQLRVLICEDDDDIATLCEFLLRNAGFEISRAQSLQAARQTLAENHYDAMILDLGLPDADGMTLIRELDAQHSRMPVIIVSANATEAREVMGGKTTCVKRWLNKPVDQKHLVDSVLHSIQRPTANGRRILHVEDDSDIILLVQAMLDDTWEVIPATSLKQAREQLMENDFDLVMLDIGLPDGSGLELLPEIKQLDYPVVLFSEEDSFEDVLFDFDAKLVKAYTSSAKLLKTLLDLTEAA